MIIIVGVRTSSFEMPHPETPHPWTPNMNPVMLMGSTRSGPVRPVDKSPIWENGPSPLEI